MKGPFIYIFRVSKASASIVSIASLGISINYGGFTNGNGGINNTKSFLSGWSAVTVNTRTSNTQTTSDEGWLTTMTIGIHFLKSIDLFLNDHFILSDCDSEGPS